MCAWCGKPILRCGRITTTFEALKGHPTVGWHSACAEADSIGPNGSGPIGAFPTLEIIQKRGNNRIISGCPDGDGKGYHFFDGLRIEVANKL